MPKIPYLCIDDHPEDFEGLLNLMQVDSPITIDVRPPASFDETLKWLSTSVGNTVVEGLLLDLRLDQTRKSDSAHVDYNAPELAALLRNRMAQQKTRDLPIVLWTISRKLRQSYLPDISSHDLFDLVLDKEILQDQAPARSLAMAQLLALSKGYENLRARIGEAKHIGDLLECPCTDLLDSRIGEQIIVGKKSRGVGAAARFIRAHLIEQGGPLVDEPTLCARLGTTIESFRGSKLGRHCKTIAAYNGPFASGWTRWWWPAIEKWWNTSFEELPAIRSLTAEDRVSRISALLKDRSLQSASPLTPAYSTRYSTCCVVTGVPLDPIDGFMLSATSSSGSEQSLYPWQDRKYVAREVALAPAKHKFEVAQLDAVERHRLNALKPARRTRPSKHA